jgi:hypothetical protein
MKTGPHSTFLFFSRPGAWVHGSFCAALRDRTAQIGLSGHQGVQSRGAGNQAGPPSFLTSSTVETSGCTRQLLCVRGQISPLQPDTTGPSVEMTTRIQHPASLYAVRHTLLLPSIEHQASRITSHQEISLDIEHMVLYNIHLTNTAEYRIQKTEGSLSGVALAKPERQRSQPRASASGG